MNRVHVFLVVSTVLGGGLSVFAKGQEDDLPLAARSAIQELDRTVRDAKKRAVEKLRAVMRNEMQTGNLERANRINQEILKISESTDGAPDGTPLALVVGEWQTQGGVAFTFDKNKGVKCGNGWSGKWRLENKCIYVLLNTLNGVVQPSVNQYYYEAPVPQEIGNHSGLVMKAQAGYEDQTLYRK